MKNNNKPKLKIWRYILILILLLSLFYFNKINVENSIEIKKWDNYSKIWDELSRLDRTYVKIYLKTHSVDLPDLTPGVLEIAGNYTSKGLIKILSEKSTVQSNWQAKLTIIEWRNIYDIDKLLTKRWYISAGEYINYVTSSQNISDLQKKYTFLDSDIKSLEWYLYPDTYIVNPDIPVIPQLLKLQLDNFGSRVWDNYQFLFNKFNDSLTADGFGFKLSNYSVIKLASIIENEEKNTDNRPTIAGIFLNRIRDDMRLDADYTLCYGYQLTHDQCVPDFIVSKLNDNSNPYNTRQIKSIPPTPINNPSISSIAAVLKYNLNEYHYYLHASDGQIYYAKNLTEHNANKSKYLK